MTGRHLLYGQFKIICVSWAWNHSYSIENHNFFNIIVRPTKIIIRAHKNWMHVFLFKMKYFENQKFKNDQLLNFSYFDIIQWEKIKKIPLIFKPKYVITLNILQSLGRLLIILVGLTMTWYSEKIMTSTKWICDIMWKSYKKSSTVSNLLTAESSAPFKNHATYKIKYLSINKRSKIKKIRFFMISMNSK